MLVAEVITICPICEEIIVNGGTYQNGIYCHGKCISEEPSSA